MVIKVASKASKKTVTRKVGVKHGLTQANTWIKLFSDNAKAAKSNRMTDEQITAALKAEFRATPSSNHERVTQHRNIYNTGSFPSQNGKAPAVRSVRFDKSGEPMKGRAPKAKGSKKATPAKKSTPAKIDSELE